MGAVGAWQSARTFAEQAQSQVDDGRYRGVSNRGQDPQRMPDAAVRGIVAAPRGPDFRRSRVGQRGPTAPVSLSRSAPADVAADAGDAASLEQSDSRQSRRTGFSRTGDAAVGPQLAGRGARLPGAEPGDAGVLVRAAAVTAALQADFDGGGLRQVFPDRSVP